MRPRKRALLWPLVAAALAFAPGTAAADGPRFRGGVAAGAAPQQGFTSHATAVVEVNGQLGVQINDLLGFYVLPNLDAYFPRAEGGIGAGVALMADVTLAGRVSLGLGPETQGYLAGEGGGSFFGGRATLAFHPLVYRSPAAPEVRHALSVGFDFRVLRNPQPSEGVGTTFAELFTVGYRRF